MLIRNIVDLYNSLKKIGKVKGPYSSPLRSISLNIKKKHGIRFGFLK